MSLIETRRMSGKVKHVHIAGLGSVGQPPEIIERIEFWQRLHERLAKLSNRIDAATQAKILGDIHARIPMVTPDEQRALQLENAATDKDQWSAIHGLFAGLAKDQGGLAAKAKKASEESEAQAVDAAAKAAVAQENIERLQKGEDVPGGLSKQRPIEEMLRAAGWTDADFAHMRIIGEITEIAGEAGFQKLLDATNKDRDRRELIVARSVLRQLRD